MTPFLGVILGLVFAGVSIGAVLVAGLIGWRGSDDEAVRGNYYCEELRRDRMIAQPVNTWSNLAYVAAGLIVLLLVGALAPKGQPLHPMAGAGGLPILYGLLVIFLGPGSMAFHASMRRWAGWLDNLSMNLFVTFLASYDLMRLLDAGAAVFLLVFLPLNLGMALATALKRGIGKYLFGATIGVFVIEELFLLCGVGGHRHSLAWFLAGASVFVAAFVIWLLSGTGGKLCRPRSLVQGHAFWHGLTAVSTVLFYFLLRE